MQQVSVIISHIVSTRPIIHKFDVLAKNYALCTTFFTQVKHNNHTSSVCIITSNTLYVSLNTCVNEDVTWIMFSFLVGYYTTAALCERVN